MHTPWARIALCASLLVLGACDKTPGAPPTPMVSAPASADASAASVPDPSVPAADAVFAPAVAAKSDAPAGRTNRSMSAAQESTAMPMPGQNNDHSAPLGAASAPPRAATR